MPQQAASVLHLPGSYLEKIRSILGQHAPQAEVWAYGSRVAGTGQEASDLDLVVRNPGDLNAECPGLFALRNAFVESNLPIRVDVMDWARIPAGFREEIERDYVVVQGGNQP